MFRRFPGPHCVLSCSPLETWVSRSLGLWVFVRKVGVPVFAGETMIPSGCCRTWAARNVGCPGFLFSGISWTSVGCVGSVRQAQCKCSPNGHERGRPNARGFSISLSNRNCCVLLESSRRAPVTDLKETSHHTGLRIGALCAHWEEGGCPPSRAFSPSAFSLTIKRSQSVAARASPFRRLLRMDKGGQPGIPLRPISGAAT